MTSNGDVIHLMLFCFVVAASLLTAVGVIVLSDRSSAIKKFFAV